MPLRYTCDEPGLEENWLDISERWTLRERREFWETGTDEAVLEWARRKVDGCHIVAETGAVLTQGADLTLASLDDVDLRVVGFIGRALVEAVGSLGNLGNASARLSSNGRVKLTLTKTTVTAPD
jgi:hypothetical protein